MVDDNYDVMVGAFNAVLEGIPVDGSDLFIQDVNALKSVFMDLYGEQE